jgi:hypothetical protein
MAARSRILLMEADEPPVPLPSRMGLPFGEVMPRIGPSLPQSGDAALNECLPLGVLQSNWSRQTLELPTT